MTRRCSFETLGLLKVCIPSQSKSCRYCSVHLLAQATPFSILSCVHKTLPHARSNEKWGRAAALFLLRRVSGVWCSECVFIVLISCSQCLKLRPVHTATLQQTRWERPGRVDCDGLLWTAGCLRRLPSASVLNTELSFLNSPASLYPLNQVCSRHCVASGPCPHRVTVPKESQSLICSESDQLMAIAMQPQFRHWHHRAWLLFLHVSWRACKMGFSKEIMLQSWKNRSCQSSALRTWRKASSLSSIRRRRSLPWAQGRAEHIISYSISPRHTSIISWGLLYTPIPTAPQSTEWKNECKKKINVPRTKIIADASNPVLFAVSMRMPCSSNSEELEQHFARGHAYCAHKPIGEHSLRCLRYESSWIMKEVQGLCRLLTWLWALLNLRLAKWKCPRGVLHTTIHYHFLSDSLA